MMTLTNLTVVLSATLTLSAAAMLGGCAVDATPGDQSSSQNSLAGAAPLPPAKGCATFDGNQQKCEAQPLCDYVAAKNVCIDAPGAPPSSSADPCTQAFGKDERQCLTKAPRCMYDKTKSLCVLGSSGSSTSVSKCGSYTDPNMCLADKSCTYDKAKMACVDAASTASAGSATNVVDAYCTTTYGADPKTCNADVRCTFDTQKNICRGR